MFVRNHCKNELKQVNKNGAITKLFTYNNGSLTNVYKDDKITLINYDKYGNMLNIDDAVLTYNSRNMLDSYVNYYTNNSVYFSYNYQGVRYQKRCGSINNGNIINSKIVNYYLDGTKILGEDWSDSDENVYCKFRYFYDNEGITGIRYDGYNYNLVRDTLGNISKVMYQGKVLGEYIYDAWGNSIIKELNTLDDRERFVLHNNPFRYRGYYYDVETGLFWISSRYYNPEWGRWISPDDIEYLDPESVNGLNLYCYCGNDPINRIDPTGHFWVLLGAIAIGALIGVGFNAYDQLSENGWDFSELNIGELAQSAIVGGALGLSFAMGVGYLGPLMSGAITLTNVAYAVGGLAASTVISYCAGTIGYAVNETLNGRDYEFNAASNYGKNVAGESIFRYINGGLIGSFGNVGTKGRMFVTAEWWQKTVLGIFANEVTKRIPRGGLLPALNF